MSFVNSSRCILRRFGGELLSKSRRNFSVSESRKSSPFLRPFLHQRQRFLNYSSLKGDSDVFNFLSEEIKAEKDNQSPLPVLPGFSVKQEKAELTFTKEINSEKIMITLNVNHTVDSSVPDDGTQEAPEMKSKPNFEVDIIKSDGNTLSFSCSFIPEPENDPGSQSQEISDDVFAIDEVTKFKGDPTDNDYAVAGDILDGDLYDLFMNMLDERGINNETVSLISDYCSSYEHTLYIQMLQDIQKFVKT